MLSENTTIPSEAPPSGGVVALQGRELEWATNTPEIIEAHKQFNGSIIRTRFPPEPNGYLHIGHAKSINTNFNLAFEKLKVPTADRRTVFRYDDTNPDAESTEYIDSIANDLKWLGWTPERTTYSSNNFDQLFQYCVTLMEKGLAYCCDFKKEQVKAQRDLANARVTAKAAGKDLPSDESLIPGPNRNTSSTRNLEIFHNMAAGVYDEGSWTVRLKMDLTHPNPNMYDLVAYRIKYTHHPHAGDKWCIYPSYDFTHGICDSLENIDYSICTLEFENRREPYYWILWALDLYKPNVFEMSRLNLCYTVLSKRRLLKLVTSNKVRGWNDPRMPTISGLRRRGYTAKILKSFCDDLGITRNENYVEVEKLNQTTRLALAPLTRRAMVCLSPIKIEILNWEEGGVDPNGYVVQNAPTDETLGSHTVKLTPTFYIDTSDFRMKDDKTYYGLAPNKAVGLKYYGGNLICEKVVSPTHLQCRLDNTPSRPKPKSFLTWVPSNGIACEIRLYNNLFSVKMPTDSWEDELNPQSEIVYPNAMIDPSVAELCDAATIGEWKSNAAFQFERFGYFVVDIHTQFSSKTNTGKLIFNRTVSLKEETAKKQVSNEEQAVLDKRKADQRAATKLKEERMKIAPSDYFKVDDEYKGKYQNFGEDGIPTHLMDGTELTKSAMKTLKKLQAKHTKAYNAFHKAKK
mmetsp:Transcript_25562/g.29497  ORF Transcript_25562/g.29497 Transcript_25562/m.29497 type:complete len:687 (-) Transcript_25562:103-2163(-)